MRVPEADQPVPPRCSTPALEDGAAIWQQHKKLFFVDVGPLKDDSPRKRTSGWVYRLCEW